jgi:hypothetical protein
LPSASSPDPEVDTRQAAAMLPGSPVKRLLRLAAKGRREKAELAGLAAAAAALLLLCAPSLRCSAAARGRLWAGGVSVTAAGSGGEEECNLFDGDWVWAGCGGYPLYDSRDCPFLDVGFRCAENGRPEASYTKWRWQPSRWHLPRFISLLSSSSLPSSPVRHLQNVEIGLLSLSERKKRARAYY